MPQVEKFGGMKVLVFATTLKEFEWARERSSQSSEGNSEWHILCLDHAFYLSSPKSEPGANYALVSLKSLDIDSEQLWRESKELQAEMNRHFVARLWQGVDIVLKEDMELFVFHQVYSETIIAAALDKVQPDKIVVPPARLATIDKSSVKVGGQFQWVQPFQGLIVNTASARRIKCEKHWSLILHSRITRLKASFGRVAGLGVNLLYDVVQLSRWLATRARRKLRSLIGQGKRQISDLDLSDSIVITNYAADFKRQFSLARVAPEFARRCVLWIDSVQRGRLSPPNINEYSAQEYMNGLPAEEAARDKDLSEIECQAFPTLVTPLIAKYLGVWHCQPNPKLKPRAVSPHLWKIISVKEAARERLTNWNRISEAIIRISFVRDLLRTRKPKLLVASDTIGTQRFFSIGAFLSGVKVMTTSHGIDIAHDYIASTFSLGDTNCLFGPTAPHLPDLELPCPPAKRIVSYDPLTSTVTPRDSSVIKKESTDLRVMIITSIYGLCTSSLGTNLFINSEEYARSFECLVQKISALCPAAKITIKSHPLNDAYTVYEEVKRKYPETVERHWREPLDNDCPIPAEAVIFYNCLSTLFFPVVDQKVPVVAHYGALTALGRRLLGAPELLSSESDEELARYVVEILENQDGEMAKDARRRADAVYNKFIGRPVGGFETAVAIALEQ
jgi:hypothetical protein